MDGHLIDRVSRSLATESSRRQIFKVVGGGAAVGALAISGLRETAAAPKNRVKNIKVSGVNSAGKKVFVGRLDIDRFAVDGNKLFAVGTLNGRLTRNNRPRQVENKTVRIPVEALNGQDLATIGQNGARAGVSGQAVCNVLTLTLGPLDLNLLGLRVQLNQINLRITAITGSLLGDLLCAVANLLSGGPLANLLNQLSGLLNQILGALG